MYVEKYPVPAFDAATVADLMPDQRQAAPYVPHIPTGRHSDDVAVQAPTSLAAPITSVGHAVPFSRLTHTTPSGHWIGRMYGGLDAYVSYVATHPADVSLTLDESISADVDFADFS